MDPICILDYYVGLGLDTEVPIPEIRLDTQTLLKFAHYIESSVGRSLVFMFESTSMKTTSGLNRSFVNDLLKLISYNMWYIKLTDYPVTRHETDFTLGWGKDAMFIPKFISGRVWIQPIPDPNPKPILTRVGYGYN